MATISTERMRGLEVLDREQQRLGTVRDLVIDTETGQVRYALLGPGGALTALGVVERVLPIPIEALAYDGSALSVSVSAQEVKGAPSFSPYLPIEFSREFETSLYQHWKLQPHWDRPNFQFPDRRVSEFASLDHVPCVAPDARMADALVLMKARGVDYLPIVDAQGRYHGTLSALALVHVVPGLGAAPAGQLRSAAPAQAASVKAPEAPAPAAVEEPASPVVEAPIAEAPVPETPAPVAAEASGDAQREESPAAEEPAPVAASESPVEAPGSLSDRPAKRSPFRKMNVGNSARN